MNDPSEELKEVWDTEQKTLSAKLETTDRLDNIKLIGGVDISFVKNSNTIACASLVVLNYSTLEVVYEKMEKVELTQPYIAGYLAFREVPFLEKLVNQLRTESAELFPQVILVDGNGILHPRGFGLASHLGVLCDVPTIGIGKNFLQHDGLTVDSVRTRWRTGNALPISGSFFDLVGDSGRVWGSAVRTTKGSVKPVYVSIGHRVSLGMAINIVLKCARYRVAEPVRQADLRSRDYLLKIEHLIL